MKRIGYGVCGLLSIAAVAYCVYSVPRANAQSGSRIAKDPFETKFWTWLQGVNYKHWAPWPGQNGDFYPGKSPHGAFLKLYANRAAVTNPKNPPSNSVIIKENFGADKKTLVAVTVMYRSERFDPEHKDWYWVKYNPDGTVAKEGNTRLAGKVKGCIDCHGGADGNDYVFANDKPTD